MTVKTEPKRIGDCTYLVTQLANEDTSGEAQFILMSALSATVGPEAVTALLAAAAGVDNAEEALRRLVAKGLTLDLQAALRSIGYDGVKRLKAIFAESTRVIIHGVGNEKPHDMRTLQHHFGGHRALDVWVWLAFCVQVNFFSLSFFSSLTEPRGEAAGDAATPSASGSPMASTGSSGAPS